MTKTAMKKATWSDLKRSLAELDRSGLMGLIQDLYAAGKENKAFLHARFDLGGDVLAPYKKTIERWLWPDLMYKNQDYSVAKAKKAIAEYKKAVGRSIELAELQVFFCEQAAGFCNQVGLDDEGYYTALMRMFEQSLETVAALGSAQQEDFIDRLEQVKTLCQDVGYGLGDDMDMMLENWYDEEEEDE
jgi:hypothetical protein